MKPLLKSAIDTPQENSVSKIIDHVHGAWAQCQPKQILNTHPKRVRQSDADYPSMGDDQNASTLIRSNQIAHLSPHAPDTIVKALSARDWLAREPLNPEDSQSWVAHPDLLPGHALPAAEVHFAKTTAYFDLQTKLMCGGFCRCAGAAQVA
jgi:hypothetical protein